MKKKVRKKIEKKYIKITNIFLNGKSLRELIDEIIFNN